MSFPHLQEAIIFTFASFIFHTVLLKLSRIIFSKFLFTKIYLEQNDAVKLDWDSRIMSTIHAIISTILAYHAIFTHPKLLEDLYFYYQPSFTFVISYTVGYLMADMPIVISQNDYMMCIHHGMGILGLSTSTTTGLASGTLIFFLTTEITTPFMNLRWFLYQSGLRDNIFYYANGLFGTLLWFVFRVLIIPYYYYLFYNQFETFQTLRPLLYHQCYLYAFTLNSLNLIWFYKIMNGLLSVLFGKKKSQ